MTEATCDKRISDHLESRLSTFRAYETIFSGSPVEGGPSEVETAAEHLDIEVGDRSGDEIEEDARERLYELPLSIDKKEVWTVLLSTGGPHDHFEAHYDREDDDVTRITYHFLDWFDGAARTLEGPDFEVAESIIRQLTSDFYAEGGQS